MWAATRTGACSRWGPHTARGRTKLAGLAMAVGLEGLQRRGATQRACWLGGDEWLRCFWRCCALRQPGLASGCCRMAPRARGLGLLPGLCCCKLLGCPGLEAYRTRHLPWPMGQENLWG